MASTFEYMEDYFTGRLSADEKSAFEEKCATDLVFAEEVAFYINARVNLKNELYNQKKKEFDEMYLQLAANPQHVQDKAKPHPLLKKLIPYFTTALAACLLLVVGWFFLFNNASPQQLAGNYIQDNLQTLSITMSSRQDSLQKGIAAFNRKDYSSAQTIFLSLVNQNTQAPEALKNLGILYVVTGQYDKAIVTFDELSRNKDLYANPGTFYKAVTLMQRAKPQDLKEARILLQQVVDQQLPGSKEAAQWLEEW